MADQEAPTTAGAPTTAERSPTRVRVGLVIAAACTVYEVLSGALVPWTGLGFLPLLLIVPVYFTAIMLLVWVGQQGIRRLRIAAIVVGVVLAASLPMAVGLALAVGW
ncbi:hypothetical protein [Curtobacterium sp. CFBP9011]|uniref:hypothetical protein n=1 Tax=Curtobacterium sp. CFBP9011 TaxID=3096530 RepID=UPI002A69B7A3|nr:hypothetical protein [Curtobacterium sp. CFBP9011]MDY1006096.1 hypothetical protein [Curtobacterium sp. CFBP9011]